jgi:thiol-disulfide isomerase/thioredoxin
MRNLFFAGCLLTLLHGCHSDAGNEAHLQVRIRHAIHRKVIIETLPGEGSVAKILDSATLRSNEDVLEFRIPLDEETPCRVHVPNTDLSVPFILHAGETRLEGDIILPSDMAVVHSSVNTPLWAFLTNQRTIMERQAALLDSSQQAGDAVMQALWQSRYDSARMSVQRAYRNYSDTVTSPGAFLYTYTYVDFGRDFDSLRAFILRTEVRFPNSPSVARLRARTLDFLKTFEIELEVGDSLPPLALPDALGTPLPVSAPGRHLLVNFWSTWCNPCIAFLDEQKRLQPWLKAGRLQVVNIALDQERDTWRFLTLTRQVPGVNLIDTGVWQGAVIRQWRIDSIPFNWLIGPDGKIVRKAIPKDSLFASIKAVLGVTSR